MTKDFRSSLYVKVPDAVIVDFLVVESNVLCWDFVGASWDAREGF